MTSMSTRISTPGMPWTATAAWAMGLGLLLWLAMAGAAAVRAQDAPHSDPICTVRTTRPYIVNLREGPGIDHVHAGTAVQGTALTGTGRAPSRTRPAPGWRLPTRAARSGSTHR